jgi:dienelactone hydrolase
MSLSRRQLLAGTAGVVAAGRLGGVRLETASADLVCDPPAPFDPARWMAERGQGLLQTKTPQSNLPLRPIAARNAAAWHSERAKYATAWRELIGPWPLRPALDPQVIAAHDDPDFTRLKVSYKSLLSGAPYASDIRAWLFLPKGPVRPRPAIVCLHQTVPQGKNEPAGIATPGYTNVPWLAYADYYARRGYVTLAPDTIGYGERTKGCYAEQSFELADAWPILQPRRAMTLLGLMLFDVTRAVDYLQARPDVDGSRIGVIGHSLGGILVNGVLGLEPRFRVGVASCGYGIFRTDAFFERWAGTTSAYLPRMWKYRINRNALPIDMLQVMALAAPAAHLVQTALLDTIWSPTAVAWDPVVARELKRVHGFYGAGAGTRFVSVEADGDHGWYPQGQAAADALLAHVLGPV